MKRTWAVWAVLGVAAIVAACSGDSTGETCSAVAACTVLPLSLVNMQLGNASTSTDPTDTTTPTTTDVCVYNGALGVDLQTERVCYGTTDLAVRSYMSNHDGAVAGGRGPVVDVTGVGDRAYYTTDLPNHVAELDAEKGNVLIVLLDYKVPAGQETMVKLGLISLANTLLAAN